MTIKRMMTKIGLKNKYNEMIRDEIVKI